jgi:hypothetical protein
MTSSLRMVAVKAIATMLTNSFSKSSMLAIMIAPPEKHQPRDKEIGTLALIDGNGHPDEERLVGQRATLMDM